MRRAVVVLVVVGTAALTVVLREATMSRHRPMPSGTVSELVIQVTSNERSTDLVAATSALLATCSLEVASDPLGPPVEVRPGTFALRLEPALDETDRRQLDGCLEDALLDRVQAKVLRSRHRAVAPPTG